MQCSTHLSTQQNTNPLTFSASSQSLSTPSDPLLSVSRILCKFAAPLFSGDERKGARNGSWVVLRKSGSLSFHGQAPVEASTAWWRYGACADGACLPPTSRQRGIVATDFDCNELWLEFLQYYEKDWW